MLAALEDELTKWRFEVPSDAFLHDALSRLIRDFESFEEDEVPGVMRRLEWADRVEVLTVERFAGR